MTPWMSAALGAAVVSFGALQAQASPPASPEAANPAAVHAPADDAKLRVDFIQQAQGMRFDGRTLTLTGLAPATTIFSDTPDRMTGTMTKDRFLAAWNGSIERFADQPRMAAATATGPDGRVSTAVVELDRATPTADGIAYSVQVLQGELPATAAATSLYIDPWIWAPGWRERCRWSVRLDRRVCRWD